MPSVVLATSSYDHTIRFWEAPSGICYRTIQHPESQVNALAISPDKQCLATAGFKHVRLYSIGTNNPNPIKNFEGHTANVTCVGFQREGKWMFTGSEDQTIKIWDLRSCRCTREYKCLGGVNSLSLHPNQGELFSGDQNGNVRIWDLAADQCVQELVPDEEVAIRSVCVGDNGKICVAANNKGVVFVWNIHYDNNTNSSNNNNANNTPNGTRTGSITNSVSQLQPLKKIQAHKKYILKALLSPDCRQLATASADHTVKLWRTDDWTLHKTLSGHQRWVWDAAYSADSAYLVTASSDNSARLWDLSRGETIRHYTGHHKPVVCVALNDQAG